MEGGCSENELRMGLTLFFKFLYIPHSCFMELSVSFQRTHVSPHWWVPQKCQNTALFRTSENPVFANWFLSLTSHFCSCCCWRQILLGSFRASFLYWCEATQARLTNSIKGRKLGYGWNTPLCLGICFPWPSWYTLQTRKPLSSNWTFLIWLMPSSFADGSQDTSTHSQKTTFMVGTPLHESTASLICTGVSILVPAFRWILMCNLIVAAFGHLQPCFLADLKNSDATGGQGL